MRITGVCALITLFIVLYVKESDMINFEKSKKDKEKGKGKEGSKKEEKFDKSQKFPAFKKGGVVGKKKKC